MTPLAANILLVVCSVVVGILAVGGDTCRHEGQHRRITARGWWSIIFLCAGLILGAYKEISSAREMADLSTKLEKSRYSQLNFSSLRPLDVGMSVDTVIEQFGSPAISRTISADAHGQRGVVLHYARWQGDDIELQTLTTPDKRIQAFVVRTFEPEQTYTYTSSPINWNLGHSTFFQIFEDRVEGRFSGPDAKFFTYVEKGYFGRWGHYNNFYFSAPWHDATIDEYAKPNPTAPRKQLTPNAVCVATTKSLANPNKDADARWSNFLVGLVGIHGERYEEGM